MSVLRKFDVRNDKLLRNSHHILSNLLIMPIEDAQRSGAQVDNDALIDLGFVDDTNEFVTEDPGETFDTALDIEVFDDGQFTYTDEVGSRDSWDLYQFDISQSNDFNFVLKGMNADADLQLFDGTGEAVAISDNIGNVEILTGSLSAGNYFLGVNSYDGIDTNYELSVLYGENAYSSAEIINAGIDSVLVTEF